MIRYILLALLISNSYAGLLDFDYLQKAKDAYNSGDFKTASQNYDRVDNDNAKYNEANALYKQKKYQETLDLYSSITNKNLEFEKLYNMGNAQAKLGKTDFAIKSYEDALKIKDDSDAKFNLELLKKQQKQNKKDNKKQDKNKQNDQDKKDQKNQEKKNKDQKQNSKQKDSKDQKDKKQENKKNNQQQKDDQKDQKKSDKKDKQDKDKKDQQKQKAQKEKERSKKEKDQNQKASNAKQQPPISNMEERKWQKMLNNRGVNTLMLPIKKGELKNETNPW